MAIPLDQAELLALFLENITYGLSNYPSRKTWRYHASLPGVFLSFFILLMVISLGEKDIHFSNQRFILPVATLMLLLATIVSAAGHSEFVYQFSLGLASFHWFRPCSGGICYRRSGRPPSSCGVLSSYFPTSPHREDTGVCPPDYSWGRCACEIYPCGY